MTATAHRCQWAGCGKPATHAIRDPREEPGKQSWWSCADCAREARRELCGLLVRDAKTMKDVTP